MAVITTLPCPPADLVQEDLWGRGSPEIQAPPGNIEHSPHQEELLKQGETNQIYLSSHLSCPFFFVHILNSEFILQK